MLKCKVNCKIPAYTDNQQKWFYYRDGKASKGPVDLVQLRKLYHSKRIAGGLDPIIVPVNAAGFESDKYVGVSKHVSDGLVRQVDMDYITYKDGGTCPPDTNYHSATDKCQDAWDKTKPDVDEVNAFVVKYKRDLKAHEDELKSQGRLAAGGRRRRKSRKKRRKSRKKRRKSRKKRRKSRKKRKSRRRRRRR